MSDEVLSPDEQIIRDMGDEMNEIRVGRAKAYFQIRRLRTQLAEANTRIETLTRRLEAAQERAEAWEEAALGKTGKLEFDEMERSWRETVAQLEVAEAELVNWKEKYFHEEDMGDDERKEHLETREKLKKAEFERDELKRKLDDCQCETRVLNESMLIEAKQERDQLAAEGVRLREALERLEGYHTAYVIGYHIAINKPVKRLEDIEWHEAELQAREALAATPQAAKAAERVKATGDVLKIARKATTARWDLIGGMPSQVEDLRDALDRLDAVDKPKEEEALK